jgi:DNA-binding SARP family transcriptional activator/Tfp pilus assembly protein PilF
MVVTGMRFGLLGPVTVCLGDRMVPVPAGKQRAVLAALLLNANRVVPVEELAKTLWGAAPPPSARVTVQNHVGRLRKALGDEGCSRIATHRGGYVITVADDELDTNRFELLIAAARRATRDGSWDTAAAQARAALALWRGDPLGDVESELLAVQEVPRLADLRLQALETRINADLHLGWHAEVTGELRQLTAAHPLREHLHALLMLALYRDGRQGEALAAYQAARRVILEELGAEPGPELRALHQQILQTDAALDLPGPQWPAGGVGRVVPQQLPPAVPHFTGRAGELAALTRLLDEPPPGPGTVVISAIGGTAGVGKTALAIHWAHQVAGRFPDGQLYVSLRGHDPDRPMAAADALGGFLRALGVPHQDVPAEQSERAARYRSQLAGRRMLVILDNAASAEQVRPLLPGTPTCTVVVTSRDALTGLVARDGATRVDLGLLPLADAVSLLRVLIGSRTDTEPKATARLAAQCCRLPLALRVAAELAAAQPAIGLADLASELADRQQRLDLLDAGGDLRTAVRAVFSWSYRHLDPGTARAFRLIGQHPGPTFDAYAAAALTGTSFQQACRALDVLARAHLIQAAGPGQYGMHDLLRAYACKLPGEAEAEQHAALTRLFDHYLHTAARAMDMLFPAERHRRPSATSPVTPAPPLASAAAARAWLDTERATLVAVAAHAAVRGWPGHATRLAATLFRYLDAGHYLTEAAALHGGARRAARRAGDPDAEATALISLGIAVWKQGRFQQATGHFRDALDRYRRTGDRTGEARALNNLGVANLWQGRLQQATGHFRDALDRYRQTGDRTGEAHALGNIGVIDRRLGRYQQATSCQEQSGALCREIGDRKGEADALTRLGDVELQLGRYGQAADHLHRALALYDEIGDRPGTAEALTRLGDLHARLGRHRQAVDCQQQSLAVCREIGDRKGEAEALNGLGDVLLATGQPCEASIQHAAALSVTREIRDTYGQARAHCGLGHAHQAAGDPRLAREHWQEAATLYAGLGAPEADQIRAQLTGAENRGHRLHESA